MFNMFKQMFLNLVQEVFIVYWLNSANKVIGFDTISQGNLNSSIVHPREVFRGAVISSCASIILAHNHPSGNPEPSAEDISITKKIHEAGKLLDIPVFDHIIFAGDSYTSFVEKRLI
jgi:DNA repair protein RadC